MITFSIDNTSRLSTNFTTEKNANIVGRTVKVKQYSTIPDFYKDVLQHGNTIATASIIDVEASWAKLGAPNGWKGRPLITNTLGFQSIFIDVDDEVVDGVHIPTYILNNIKKMEDLGVSLIYKSPSHGKEDPSLHTGVKKSLRLMIGLDNIVSVKAIQNSFKSIDYDFAKDTICKPIMYTLDSDTKWSSNDEEHHISREILNSIYTYYVMYVAKKLGLQHRNFTLAETLKLNVADYDDMGYDPASLKIVQKMFGSTNDCLLLNDNRWSAGDIWGEAVEWVKSGMQEIVERTYTRSSTKVSNKPTPSGKPLQIGSDEVFTNPDIMDIKIIEAILPHIPKRKKGTNTHGIYFSLISALKSLGFGEDVLLKIAQDKDDLNSLLNKYNGLSDEKHAYNTVMKKARELGVLQAPSNKHSTTVYHKEFTADERYINANNILDILRGGDTRVVIQSIHNTGKTTAIKSIKSAIEDDTPVVFVSHLRSILRTTSKKLGLHYYEDDRYPSPNTSIAITPDSFRILKGYDLSKCLIVIDEHTQVLRKIATDYKKSREPSYLESIKLLFESINDAKYVIAMDADDYIGFPEIMEKPVLYRNKIKTEYMQLKCFRWAGGGDEEELFIERKKNYKKDRATSTTHSISYILSALANKKILAIPCTKKSSSIKLDAMLREHGYKGILLNAETEDKLPIIDEITSGTAKYQYVIYTYTAWTGFDVSHDKHDVDEVVALFENVDGLRHDDMAQAMRRFRGVKYGTVYGNWRASFDLSTFDEHMTEVKNKELSMLRNGIFKDFDDVMIHKLDNRIDNVLQWVAWYENVMRKYTNYQLFINKIDPNATIDWVTNAWKPANKLVTSIDHVYNKLKDNAQEIFKNSPIASYERYAELLRKDRTVEENTEVVKSTLAYKVGRETTEQLSNLIPLSKAKKIPLILQGYMVKDREFAKDLCKWRANRLASIQYLKDDDKLIRSLFQADFKHDIKKSIHKSRIIHKLIAPLIDKPMLAGTENDMIQKLFESCIKYVKKYKEQHLTIDAGDTMVMDLDEKDLNVSYKTHEVFENKLISKVKAHHMVAFINRHLKPIGYTINTTRFQKNKINHVERTISLTTEMQILIDTKAPEYYKDRINPPQISLF